jgi:hypothetical protein
VLRELPTCDYDRSERTSPRSTARRWLRSGKPLLGAGHPRLQGRYETAARFDHYLDLLRIKPGALKGSLPLRQERSHSLEIFGGVMAIFFVISFPLTRLAAYLERRLA